MASIRIGPVEKKLAEASKSWINQEINGRRAAGEEVCVQVTIHEPDVRMGLATPSCGGGPGGRRPNPREQNIFDLWEKCGLNRSNFASGNVIAFLEQLERLL